MRIVCIWLAVAAMISAQQCNVANCNSCVASNPNKCANCFTGYTAGSTDGLCRPQCKVANCDYCLFSQPNVCSSCFPGFKVSTVGGFETNPTTGQSTYNSEITECKETTSLAGKIFLYAILLLLVAAVTIGIACWCVVHKKKVSSQQAFRTSEITTEIYPNEISDNHHHANQLRHVPELYQPVRMPPQVAPVPNYQIYAASPPPPPGNSLLFEHKQAGGLY